MSVQLSPTATPAAPGGGRFLQIQRGGAGAVEVVTAFSFNFPTNSRLNRNCKSNKTIKMRTGYYKCVCTSGRTWRKQEEHW